MKTLIWFLVVVPAIFGHINILSSQTTENKLDQVKLMKQFIGKWQCETGSDSFCIWEINSFGNGFEGTIRHTAKAKTYYELKQIWGYDQGSQLIYCYYLGEDGTLRRYKGSFITEKTAAMEQSNITSGKILSTAELSLVSPDVFTHTTMREGSGKKSITFQRIKK